jgi:hypothetical protein
MNADQNQMAANFANDTNQNLKYDSRVSR